MRLSYVPIITEAWITMRHVKDIRIIIMGRNAALVAIRYSATVRFALGGNGANSTGNK